MGGWIFNRQHREWVAGFIVAVVLLVVVYYTLGASREELELHKRLMAPTRSRFSSHHCPQINCKREWKNAAIRLPTNEQTENHFDTDWDSFPAHPSSFRLPSFRVWGQQKSIQKAHPLGITVSFIRVRLRVAAVSIVVVVAEFCSLARPGVSGNNNRNYPCSWKKPLIIPILLCALRNTEQVCVGFARKQTAIVCSCWLMLLFVLLLLVRKDHGLVPFSPSQPPSRGEVAAADRIFNFMLKYCDDYWD